MSAVSIVLSVDNSILFLVLALSVSSSVLVFVFFFKRVVIGIVESVIVETTIATVVSETSGAINQLLLREGDKFSSGNSVSTFHGGYS